MIFREGSMTLKFRYSKKATQFEFSFQILGPSLKASLFWIFCTWSDILDSDILNADPVMPEGEKTLGVPLVKGGQNLPPMVGGGAVAPLPPVPASLRSNHRHWQSNICSLWTCLFFRYVEKRRTKSLDSFLISAQCFKITWKPKLEIKH